MVRHDFVNPRHFVRGVFALFALIGTLAAAEPPQRDEERLTAAVKSAAPTEGQPSELHSKLNFYGEFGPIFLHRQGNRSAILIGDLITGTTVLNATSLDLGWKTGLEARGGVKLGDFGAEFRWFNVGRVLHGWSEESNLTTPAIWAIPTRPVLFGLGVANASIDLSSVLTNMEGNLSWRLHPYVTLLAGVRYLSLDDDLGMGFDFTGNVANIEIESRNTLWGGQLGVEGRYPVLAQDLLVGATVKAAYLHNASKNKFTLVQQVGSSFAAGDRDGLNTWAFELGMDLRYNIFSMVALVGGYQALWIGKIAQGTDQVKKFNLVTGGGSVKTRSLWFHGPRAAIVIRLPG